MTNYFVISLGISIVLVVCIISTAANTSRTNDYLKAILEELRKRPM